ncbi:hypothetical protein VRB37_07930 [Erwinia billingiae]|uniref:hypothetical protein n=1 Tax=Erwinia billingiae TaxID=182337 RepID=UPI0030CC8C3A
MKIYDWYDGPYPARVRIALAEKGMLSTTEFVPVNLWTGEHKKTTSSPSTIQARCLFWSLMTARSSQSVRLSRSIWMRLKHHTV